MTELEMAKHLFEHCSIWRGGASLTREDGSDIALPIHIAVKLKNGKNHYEELVMVFNKDGRWVNTYRGK